MPNRLAQSLLLLLLISFLGGCTEAEPTSTHRVVRSLSGGEYTLIHFSGMDAELAHPSIEPSVESYFLCLPLPRVHEEAAASSAMAQMTVEEGQLVFTDTDDRDGASTFPIVVRDGEAVFHQSPRVEFRTVLFREGGQDWHLAISTRQHSLRQIGEDLVELGVSEAYDVSMTAQKGWYRYADAAFELRKKRDPVEDLLLFHPAKKN